MGNFINECPSALPVCQSWLACSKVDTETQWLSQHQQSNSHPVWLRSQTMSKGLEILLAGWFLLFKCSFSTLALHHSVTDLLSLWSSSASCPEALFPHVNGSVVVSGPAQSCPYAELHGRKLCQTWPMGYGNLEVLGCKLKAKLCSRDRKGISVEFHVRSEGFIWVRKQAVQWLCLCTGGRELQACGP